MIRGSGRRPWLVALGAMALGAGGCRSINPEKTVVLPSPAPMAEFWAEPADLASRNLLHGEGGAALAPAPGAPFMFVKKKEHGFSPGYTVKDARGTRWHAKMGIEARPEVTVSRLLWAIGFRQPPLYLLESWTLGGGPEPGPKGPARFRPELPGWKDRGSWLWRRNPFVGTRPLRGLIVFMRLVNNWDILDRNNEVYDLDPPRHGVRRFYVVKDLGSSLGRTSAFVHQGTKSDVEDFEKQAFIDQVEGGIVHFDDKGRRHRDLYRNIGVDDVRWTCDRLARLTPEQWQDAFRAAGYDAPTAGRFIRRLQDKVEQGRRLP
ncbi:MAG: hypothetical protein DMF80_07665 [Acidobacteria bacterium]|nr:MAG: hypothetical protein DMF80_07665 [Acidobacteriota bacterium]